MARVSHAAPSCSVQTLVALVAALRKWGVDPAPVCERAGITEAQLEDDGLRIPIADACGAWDVATERTGDPAIGLHVVESMTPETPGGFTDLFAYLAITSATRREAFERSNRYLRIVHDDHELEFEISDGRSICRIDPFGGAPPHLQRTMGEYVVGMMARIGPVVVGSAEGMEVWFAHPAPDYEADYARVIEIPYRFDARCYAIVGAEANLDMPLPRADSRLCELLEQHAEELLSKLPDGGTFADRVKQQVASMLPSGETGADRVAEALGVSVSTLRRRLRAADTSHRQILDAARCDLARRALVEKGVSVNEVAFLLGFSDASAFHKAFRRWTGRSPSEFVRAARNTEA